MAHCLHYLLKENLIKLNDDFETVDFGQVDQEEVQEMVERNHLCFKIIKVFSLKVREYTWAFVFAATEEEAIAYTKNELKHQPKNCIEYHMDIDMEKDDWVLSFRDMKNEYSSFPALAGYFEKELVYR